MFVYIALKNRRGFFKIKVLVALQRWETFWVFQSFPRHFSQPLRHFPPFLCPRGGIPGKFGFFVIADAQTEQQYRRVGSTSALYMAFRRKADRPQFFPTYERMAKNIFLAWRSLLFRWAVQFNLESRVRPSSLVCVVGLIWRPSMVSW